MMKFIVRRALRRLERHQQQAPSLEIPLGNTDDVMMLPDDISIDEINGNSFHACPPTAV
jgi:hypothetical protein